MQPFHLTAFFGVIDPHGRIEAVDITQETAAMSAANLSPNPKHPNRTVEPVLCFRGSLEDLFSGVPLEQLVTQAKEKMRAAEQEILDHRRATLKPASVTKPSL